MFHLWLHCDHCPELVAITVTHDQVRRWLKGDYVQDVFASLTPDEREMLLSRVCGSCWDRMFKENEEL